MGNQNSGKLLIVAMISLAIAMAGFAWWFQFSRGQRALAYWGGDDASVIRHGTQANLLILAPDGDGESIVVDGSEFRVEKTIPLDDAPGFIHARHALIDDASYQWEIAPQKPIAWTHAMRFKGKDAAEVTVAIALDQGVMMPNNGKPPLSMSEKLRSGLEEFFAEYDPAEEEPESDE